MTNEKRLKPTISLAPQQKEIKPLARTKKCISNLHIQRTVIQSLKIMVNFGKINT